jgi:orotate phosphoribosyltransferase
MHDILGMTKEELITLTPDILDRLLTEEEILHIAKVMESYWEYDYQAVEQGKIGLHAELKSGRHSDGFFVSRILLQHPNIRQIMANQIALRFNQIGIPKPDWVAGIPDGATELGQDVAMLMDVEHAEMRKENGHITLISLIGPQESLLLVEDFCTRGTGFQEAIADIKTKQPDVVLLPYEMVIINRGGLTEIEAEEVGTFKIIAVADHRVEDWDPAECPLCKMGSRPIKPKATDENWLLITTSQK